jgi:hypothetical protein
MQEKPDIYNSNVREKEQSERGFTSMVESPGVYVSICLR